MVEEDNARYTNWVIQKVTERKRCEQDTLLTPSNKKGDSNSLEHREVEKDLIQMVGGDTMNVYTHQDQQETSGESQRGHAHKTTRGVGSPREATKRNWPKTRQATREEGIKYVFEGMTGTVQAEMPEGPVKIDTRKAYHCCHPAFRKVILDNPKDGPKECNNIISGLT